MRRTTTKMMMLMVVTATFVMAQGYGRVGANRNWWMDDLNLTVEQQKSITTMQTQFQKDQIKIRSRLETSQVDLHALMTNPSENATQIKTKQAEINQIRTELQNAGVDHRVAIRKLLTPEQQTLFDQRGGRGMGNGQRMRDGRGSGGMGGRGQSGGPRGIHTPGTGGGAR